MSEPLLNIHACYISEADKHPPKFTHRIRYAVNLFNTLESFLLGIATTSDPDGMGLPSDLLLCFIEHVEGLGTILGREFPQFPKPILSYIKSSNAFASGNSLAPQWQNNCGLSFLENYLRIESESPDDSEDQLPGYHLGTFKIRSMPLAVWTGGHLGAKQRSVPVVMVIGNWDQQDIMQFVRHYEGPRREEMRLRRLMESHEWIYHDLFSTFMDWNEVWDNVRDRLGELDYEVHHRLGKGDILGRIQSLNKATATNIMLRETLNIQKNSLDTVIKMVTKNRDTAGIGHSLAFVMRGEELLKALEHYWTLAHGNKEQLQNLVSMMLSLEQISQGQSVGRLNILAFTFLPLSFVASIFGMTQFTISPTWYPVYALPLLSLTLVIAILLPKLISIWDNWKKPRVSNLRRRSKARTAQHNLGRALKNLFLKNEESCLPTRRLSRPRTSTRRGRSLEKATSDESLKHHVRTNSLAGGNPLSRRPASSNGKRRPTSSHGKSRPASSDGKRRPTSSHGKRRSISSHGNRRSISSHGNRRGPHLLIEEEGPSLPMEKEGAYLL